MDKKTLSGSERGFKEKEFKKLIEKGESRTLECKESLSLKNEIGETISGFSNTCNGIILIGIKDSGEIKGVQTGKKTIEELANYIKQNTDNQVYPDINVNKVNDKNIIIIKVSEADEKPVFFRGKAYMRVGKSNHKLSASEIRKLAKESGKKVCWDGQVCEGAGLEDVDGGKIKKYLEYREKYRNISKDLKISLNKFLENVKAVKNKKPTNAGILFFGKYPQKFMTNARLRVIRFKGTKIIHPTLDSANCEGTIWEMIDIAEDFIRKNIRLFGTRTEKSFQREDKFEYPIKALREAMINALIHRNYLETGDVRVFIFDNRVEIINPGTFPKGVTPKKPKHKPVNEILSQFVYDIGFVDKYGSGINLMKDLCRQQGNKEPFYKLHSLETKIIFESPVKESTFIEENVLEELNERQRKAIDYLKINKTITNKRYCSICRTDRATAFRDLRELEYKEVVLRQGRGRSLHYVLCEANSEANSEEVNNKNE